MDPTSRAILKSVRALGYHVKVIEGDDRVSLSARDTKTGETFIVRGGDLYAAACELAQRVGILLDDG